MIRRPPRSTQSRSSAASDVYKRQYQNTTTVCRGTQIRVRTFVNQSVLRDDWNPSQSESSFNVLYTETLVVAHQGFSAGGGCWVSTHKLILHYVGTPQVWQVLSALEHPVLGPTVESTLVPAPFACDLFRFGLSFSSCLVSFHSKAGSFSPLLKPSLLHTLFGRLARECWSLCLRTSSYYCLLYTSPSPRD